MVLPWRIDANSLVLAKPVGFENLSKSGEWLNGAEWGWNLFYEKPRPELSPCHRMTPCNQAIAHQLELLYAVPLDSWQVPTRNMSPAQIRGAVWGAYELFSNPDLQLLLPKTGDYMYDITCTLQYLSSPTYRFFWDVIHSAPWLPWLLWIYPSHTAAASWLNPKSQNQCIPPSVVIGMSWPVLLIHQLNPNKSTQTSSCNVGSRWIGLQYICEVSVHADYWKVQSEEAWMKLQMLGHFLSIACGYQISRCCGLFGQWGLSSWRCANQARTQDCRSVHTCWVPQNWNVQGKIITKGYKWDFTSNLFTLWI